MSATLYELLLNGSYSCELSGEVEPQCSFEWNIDDRITDDGYEEFSHVLELPADVLANGNIYVDTSSDPSGGLDYEVCRFVDSLAGFCASSDWDRWFAMG